MAGLLQTDTSHTRSSLLPLLLSAVALTAAMGAAISLFFHNEDHPPVQLTNTRIAALPFHTTYTHSGKTAGGPEGGEDTTYVIATLHVHDRSPMPLFIKDITGSLQLADGSSAPFTRIKSGDTDRLLQIVPALRPMLQQAGSPPLLLEGVVPANSAEDGYVLFQFAGPASAWAARKAGSVSIDFYHQNSATVTLK